MTNEILFLIEEDPSGGYNAQALGHSIYTEGDTIEEVKSNIVDALQCHFDKEEDIPKIIRLHIHSLFKYIQPLMHTVTHGY